MCQSDPEPVEGSDVLCVGTIGHCLLPYQQAPLALIENQRICSPGGNDHSPYARVIDSEHLGVNLLCKTAHFFVYIAYEKN